MALRGYLQGRRRLKGFEIIPEKRFNPKSRENSKKREAELQPRVWFRYSNAEGISKNALLWEPPTLLMNMSKKI